MITEWIGRVLGLSDPDHATASTHPTVRLADTTTSALSSFVDSDELAAELSRARRYERDLVIAVLATQPLRWSGPASGRRSDATVADLPQVLALMSAVTLREVLRQSDIVCFQAARNRFVLGLPETGGDAAKRALHRIHTHFRKRLRLRVTSGLARFPTDAFTLDELIATAEARAELAAASSRNGRGGVGPSTNGEPRSHAYGTGGARS